MGCRPYGPACNGTEARLDAGLSALADLGQKLDELIEVGRAILVELRRLTPVEVPTPKTTSIGRKK